MKKFIKILFLLVGIVAGFSSCQKQPLDPYGPNGSYHVDQNDRTGEYSFQPWLYDVGEIQCNLPGTFDLSVNTRADSWNKRCPLVLDIKSNNTVFENGVWTNISTGTIYFAVESPGLTANMSTREYYYSAFTDGVQQVSFICKKFGSTTRFFYSGSIQFFNNEGVVNFAAFNGVYTSTSAEVNKNQIVYRVLKFTKQMSGQGTYYDQPLTIEFDHL